MKLFRKLFSLLRQAVRLAATVALAGAFFAALPAAAEVSFAGKTIKLIVPFRAGGGTDVWARFWAPIIAEKIPGKPYIDVVNIPGGGSTKGANRFARDAGTDGLVMMASSASVLYAYLLEDSRVSYEFKDWEAILSSPTGGVVYANPAVLDDGPEPLKNGKSVPWKMKIQGPTQLGMILMLSLEVLGFDFGADFGASGGMDTFQSFRNGLYNIDMQTTSSYLTNVDSLVKDQRAVPLFSFGAVDSKNKIYRDPTFPNIPTLIEVYKRLNDRKPHGPVFEAWNNFFLAGFPTQKMLVIPANTDPEVRAIFKKALEQVIEDSDKWPDTKHDILGTYEQNIGATANSLLLKATTLDPQTLSWYKGWVRAKFNINL